MNVQSHIPSTPLNRTCGSTEVPAAPQRTCGNTEVPAESVTLSSKNCQSAPECGYFLEPGDCDDYIREKNPGVEVDTAARVKAEQECCPTTHDPTAEIGFFLEPGDLGYIVGS